MTPPPSSALPLSQRLMKLAETLQFAWFIGHLTLLFSIARYSISYITFNYYSRWAKVSYRLAFMSAAVTYGIVVYKAFRARSRGASRSGGNSGAIGLLADENVQYLAMALIWLWSSQYPLAMLPFGVYSVFHVATYTRTNLIPTLQPPQQIASPSGASPSAKPSYRNNAYADTIGKFVKEYYDTSMGLVAILEVLLFFRLLLSAFTFQKGSWVLLIVYTVFLRARFAQSTFVQGQFRRIESRLDSQLSAQGSNPQVRQAWEAVKGVVRGFHDATDLGKYVNGPQAQKKAS